MFPATNRCLTKCRQIAPIKNALFALDNRHISTQRGKENRDQDIDPRAPPLATDYFNRFPSYCQMIQDAKSVARRSILVDHNGLEYINLKEFKNVERVYLIDKETRRGSSRLSIVEFKSENDTENFSNQAHHCKGLLPIPLRFFNYAGRSSEAIDKQDLSFPCETVTLSHRRELSSNFNSYTELIANNMMSLVALKLRFITLVNIERILCSGIFEEYELMPFGSSVIDIGCDSGDLDLLLTRKVDHDQYIKESLLRPSDNSLKNKLEKIPSSFVHLDKSVYHDIKDTSGIRGIMRLLSHVLREYMPLTDAYSVLSVPHAKVPIIKFTARITSIDCDLSFNLGLDHRDTEDRYYSGILMSQILYRLCRNNNLFTAILVYLRTYGKLTAITCKGGTIRFTNFQLLSLILYHLQQRVLIKSENSGKNFRIGRLSGKHKGILPPFKDLLNSNFHMDSWSLNLDNDELNRIVPILVEDFFKFYSMFNFDRDAINLTDSRTQRKIDNSSIYVVNPIDRSRNVCYNVTNRATDYFIRQLKTSLDYIEKNRQIEEYPLLLHTRHIMTQYKEEKFKTSHIDTNLGDVVRMPRDELVHDICR